MERRQLQFRVLDVFTDRPFAGNPLGVVLGAEMLSEEEMQDITREINHSETTFVLPTGVPEADYRMRIFTSGGELPFAGHPSVGTAFLLAEEGILPLSGDVTVVRQELQIGVLPLEIHSAGGKPVKVVMTQGTPELRERYEGDDLPPLLAVLGLGTRDLRDDLPVQVASTGIRSLMVPLRDLETLGRVDFDSRAARAVQGLWELSGLYAFAVGDTEVRTRFFAPGLGIAEDPATGSAAGALGAYLHAHAALPRDADVLRLMVLQGVEMGRPSIIEVEVLGTESPTEVRVGGSAITVMRGQMTL